MGLSIEVGAVPFTPRSRITVIPFGPFIGPSAILYSSVTSISTRFNRSLRKLNSMYFARPERKRSIFTRLPSLSHSDAFRALRPRSCSPVPIFTCKLLTSVVWARDFAAFNFFDSSYWYFPKSIIFATGGVAVGEISMRSCPNSCAFFIASEKEMTP